MKQKHRFLISLLMMVVMMAMSPQRMWAQTCSHEFNETSDPNHTVCTKCSHSFLRYTTQDNVVVGFAGLDYNWKDAQGNVVTLLTNTNTNGEGIIEFGSPIANIPTNRFHQRTELTSAIIPVSVKSIDSYAFRECSNLATVVVPSSLTEIKTGAFFSCQALSSIDIPNSVTSIGEQAFMSCRSLTSINIPTSLTSINSSTFGSCSGLTSVTIPGSVQSIGNNAFKDCSQLSSVTIGNSVKSIGQYAFSGCIKLQSITIPSSVESFGYMPFYHTSIMTVTNERVTPQTIDGELINEFWFEQHKAYNTDYKFLTLNVPSAGYLAYKEADEWKRFGTIQCSHCTALTKTGAQEATCQATGNQEYWTCVCGKVYKDAEANQPTTVAERTIPKAHKLTKTAAVESTCTETGHMDYWTCSHCNQMFSDANGQNVTNMTAMTTAAKGHDAYLTNGICNRCSNDVTVKTSYKKPLFFTEGDASSGVRDWEMVSNVTAIPLPSASTLQTWYAQTYVVQSGQTVTLSKGAICNGAVTLILEDGATLNVIGNENAGINVSGGSNSLTIYGQDNNSGALTATGGGASAGIGGGENGNGANITINGGTISARGTNAAGIGGGAMTNGNNGQGYNIVINGGKIDAKDASTSGEGGAGIGGGRYANGHDIVINGGEITATGGKQGAGIGGGARNYGYNILFNGGNTIAEGKNNASGIGNGSNTNNNVNSTKNGYIKFADKMGVKTHTDIIETTSDDMFATINGMSSINVHEHTNFQPDNNPKCTEYGTKSTHCSACQKTVTITDYYQLPSPGHHGDEGYTPTYVWGGTHDAATCLFTLKCNKCDKNVVTNKPLTTSKVSESHVDPGCTTTGNETWTATGSYENGEDMPYNGTAQTNNYVIPAVGHALTKTEAKPSCTEVGHNAYWTCSACSKVFADKDGTEETTVEAQTVQITGHSFTFEDDSETYLKTAATCLDNAVYYNRCANCNASSNDDSKTWTKQGSALGHGSESYTETYSWTGDHNTPACTFTLQCNKCSEKVVDGISLTCTKADHTDATCVATGSTTYKVTGSYQSANSTYNYSTQKTHDYTIAATGVHNYNSETAEDAYLMTAATCTTDAVYYHKCANCNASSKDKTNTTWTKQGSATQHSMTNHPSLNPICGTDGNLEYWTCSHTCCKDKYFKNESGTEEYASKPVIAATGTHTFTIQDESEAYLKTAATCVDDAVYYNRCANCNAISNDDSKTWTKEGTAIGHGSEGYTDTYTWTGDCYNDDANDTKACTFTLQCNKCNEKVVDGISLTCTKGEHTDAGCSIVGSTTYSATGSYTAANSSYNYSATKTHEYTIASLGHNSENGICTRCGGQYVTYRVPTYNTAGVPSSGIASWSTETEYAIPVTSSDQQVTWTTGWYFVSGDNVTFTQGAVCSGAVHLILCDGAKLTVTNSTYNKAGILVSGNDNSLTIYAQSEGSDMGVLSATAGSWGSGIGGNYQQTGDNITINGGTITATGKGNSAGIGGGGYGYGNNITINGGILTANGGPTDGNYGGGAGIGGGGRNSGKNITINGGTVIATGGKSASAIGGGTLKSGENIYINTAMTTRAGSAADPTDEITNNGSDLASALQGKQYAFIMLYNIAALEIVDGTRYDEKYEHEIGTLTYTRTFGGTNWTTWYVPFDLVLTNEICAKYDFSRINNVHQYEDENGNVDRTVIESFRQNSGTTLKANYPYLVKARTDDDKAMSLTLTSVILKPAQENSIFCQSVDTKYTFTGTYKTFGTSGTVSTAYSLYDDDDYGWEHFYTLKPQHHYLTITSRNGSSTNNAPRRIVLKVEDETTGINVNDNDNDNMAGAVYNLQGQKLSVPRKGINIINGKKVLVR